MELVIWQTMCILYKIAYYILFNLHIVPFFAFIITNPSQNFCRICNANVAKCDIIMVKTNLTGGVAHDPAKMPHYVDSILTQEDASAALQDGQVVVGLYTNRENVQSVVHSHPYYEMILPVAGSSVRYSVDGSVYDLHLGELILFPGEMYHSGKFNITDTTSERLVVQIAPGIWERAWAQSGLPRHVWSGDPVILDTDAVTQWDFRGLLERMA